MRLQLQGIGKTFGPEQALRGVDLALAPGAVVALVGGRGSGKSVLAALLGGTLRPGVGRIWLDGRPFAPKNAEAARAAGVSLLRARPSLALTLSAVENLALGVEPARYGWIFPARRRALAFRVLAALRSEDIPLDLPAARLSPAQRRRVEIARALMGRPRLIVLDEPGEPGPLGALDLENLFAALRSRAREGATVLLLTRSLEVAGGLGGHTALLREGALVGFARAAYFARDRDRALALLGGGSPGLSASSGSSDRPGPQPPRRPHRIGGPVLELRGVATRRLRGPVDLTVRHGEILGLAGLPGSGTVALLRAIHGLDPLTAGQILLDGLPLAEPGRRRRPGSGGTGLSLGLSSGPGSTQSALLPTRSVAENLTLPRLASFGGWGWYSCERRFTTALDWMEKLHIEARRPTQPAGELSRANRRKLAVGRLLLERARILLLEEPGGGINAASRALIEGWLAELAAEGKVVVIASEAFPGLLALCDTVAALRRGRLAAVHPAGQWSVETLRAAVSGSFHRRYAPSL